MLFSEAPKSVRSCVFNGKNTAINTTLTNSVTRMPEPIALCADCVSFFPWHIFR